MFYFDRILGVSKQNYHWLLSVAGMSTFSTVMLPTSAHSATTGRVLPVRLPTPTTWAWFLLASVRQTTTIVTTLSPSAASTLVMPNGGRGDGAKRE